jgi:hypothetical protein
VYLREDFPDTKDFVTTGYESMLQASTASTYPGYIFSAGEMSINMELPAYLGIIVSEGNITVKGERIDCASFRDRETIIAHGDVNIEMQRTTMDQVAIQAQNISIKVIEDFIVNDVIRPRILPDRMIIHMLAFCYESIVPGGLTIATPNGATLTGALEGATAVGATVLPPQLSGQPPLASELYHPGISYCRSPGKPMGKVIPRKSNPPGGRNQLRRNEFKGLEMT